MTTSTKLTKLSICLGVYIVDEEYKVEDEFEEQLKEDLDEEACNE
jgi:copper oxidase (laccase) domain-containing protein